MKKRERVSTIPAGCEHRGTGISRRTAGSRSPHASAWGSLRFRACAAVCRAPLVLASRGLLTRALLLFLLWPAFAFADARQSCVDAMNADPAFAQDIVKTINEKTAYKHAHAADEIALNERHVIFAYAAMWVVAALFVIFLWRRQQALRAELARLQKDLDAAIKEPAK